MFLSRQQLKNYLSYAWARRKQRAGSSDSVDHLRRTFLPSNHMRILVSCGDVISKECNNLYLPFFLSFSSLGEYLTYGPDFGDLDDSGIYQTKKKRARTTFSAEQLKRLEKRFLGNHYIVGEERQKIAKELDLSEAQVKVWFQNRRIKFKRDEELEKLGKSRKRKGEHHVRKWQLTTRHFGPETNTLFQDNYDNKSKKHH